MERLKGAWHLTHAFQGQSQNLALGTFPSPSTNKPDQILPVTRRGLFLPDIQSSVPACVRPRLCSKCLSALSLPQEAFTLPTEHISVCIHARVCVCMCADLSPWPTFLCFPQLLSGDSLVGRATEERGPRETFPQSSDT